MKKQLQSYLFIVFIILPIICFGQLSKQWEFYLPSNTNVQPSFNINRDNHLKTISLSDGSFVTLASKRRQNFISGALIYIFKYDASGKIIWEYIYENDAGYEEYPLDIATDSDDNILVAGRVITYYQYNFEFDITYSNYLLLKISSDGEFLWDKELNGVGNNINLCASVTVDSMDNIYTLGQIIQSDNYTVVLHKYDSQGNEIWSKYPNTYYPLKVEIVGEHILAITRPYVSPSPIYKYDFSGELIDSFSIDRLTNSTPTIDKEGNFYSFSFIGQYKVKKYNSTGELLWTYHKETNLPSNIIADESRDCVVDDMGNVYITGRYYGEHYGNDDLYTNGDILTVKLDSDGEVIWENIYNDEGDRKGQFGQKIQIDNMGRTYVLGYQSVEVDGDIFASKDMVLLTYNSEGEIVRYTYQNGIANLDDIGINLFINDEGVYVLGYAENDSNQLDYNVIKYSQLTSTDNIEDDLEIIAYPNPSNGKINIDCDSELTNLKVFDELGRLVYFKDFMNCSTLLDLSKNKSGVYYLYYEINNRKHQGSIVIK